MERQSGSDHAHKLPSEERPRTLEDSTRASMRLERMLPVARAPWI